MLGWRCRHRRLRHAGVDVVITIATGVETLSLSSQYWGGLCCHLRRAGVETLSLASSQCWGGLHHHLRRAGEETLLLLYSVEVGGWMHAV